MVTEAEKELRDAVNDGGIRQTGIFSDDILCGWVVKVSRNRDAAAPANTCWQDLSKEKQDESLSYSRALNLLLGELARRGQDVYTFEPLAAK